jgi:hypothetical protein
MTHNGIVISEQYIHIHPPNESLNPMAYSHGLALSLCSLFLSHLFLLSFSDESNVHCPDQVSILIIGKLVSNTFS